VVSSEPILVEGRWAVLRNFGPRSLRGSNSCPATWDGILTLLLKRAVGFELEQCARLLNPTCRFTWGEIPPNSEAFDVSHVPCWCSTEVQRRGFVLSLGCFFSAMRTALAYMGWKYWSNSLSFVCCFLTHFSKAESKASFSFIPFVI